MGSIGFLVGSLLLIAVQVYFWVIIASVVINWLIAFDVVNIRNPQAGNLVRLLGRLTEPVYRPIRKFIPPIGGIDLTPIVVIFGLYLVESIIRTVFPV